MREMEVTTLVMLDEKEEKKGNREMLRAVRNIKVGEEITVRWGAVHCPCLCCSGLHRHNPCLMCDPTLANTGNPNVEALPEGEESWPPCTREGYVEPPCTPSYQIGVYFGQKWGRGSAGARKCAYCPYNAKPAEIRAAEAADSC